LDGLHDLDAHYRLISFNGLFADDEDYEKKVRLLATLLSSKLRLPVEPFWDGNNRRLAVAGSHEQLSELQLPEQLPLTPEIAYLDIDSRLSVLKFESGHGSMTKLARKAVIWAIERSMAFPKPDWWRYGGRFVSRRPDERASTNEIVVHPAFYFGILPGRDGTLELAVDPSVCYVERQSLYQKYGKNIPARIKGGRYLHCYGDEWYKVDALGVAAPANKEMMVDPETQQPISIYERAIKRWGNKGLLSIDNLVRDAPTVAYKTIGLQTRRALSDLLYRLPGVESEDEEGITLPHRESILGPHVRAQRTEEIIAGLSSQLRLFGRKMQPSRRLQALPPEAIEFFAAPSLRFAGDQEVRNDLENAGRSRMDALRGLGPAVSTPFHDHQLIVLPESLPDGVRSDFKRRFCLQVNDLYGQPYTPDLLLYDDTKSSRTREKAGAIKKALQPHSGYGLLVLPANEDQNQLTKLHDHLKRRLWRKVQTQCASATKILDFYHEVQKHQDSTWVVRQGKESRYRSYLQQLALGFLMVNRKWLWKLAEGTMKHDVHVGIDVYKGVAVLTFVYGDADLITFHIIDDVARPEKLSADDVRDALIENLGADLAQLRLRPRSIVFHRDGLVFDSEMRGINRAVEYLQSPQMDILPADLRVGIVEIHKNSSVRPRIYRRRQSNFENPQMGTCVRFGRYEAVVLTTGEPMLRAGTAHPLYVEVVSGDVDVMEIAHDIYALSHLAFTAPGSCLRLPFTIALADYILRESTPGTAVPNWDEGLNQDEQTITLQQKFNHLERRMQR